MAEGTGLENRRRETVPEFESLPLHHQIRRVSVSWPVLLCLFSSRYFSVYLVSGLTFPKNILFLFNLLMRLNGKGDTLLYSQHHYPRLAPFAGAVANAVVTFFPTASLLYGRVLYP